MQYKKTEYLEPDEAVKIFRIGDRDEIIKALLAISIHGTDPDFSLAWCLFFLSHHDERVIEASTVSIGHIARIHNRINNAVVVPALEIVRDRGYAKGQIDDALEDIDMFCSE